MDQATLSTIILGMGLATYLPRLLPVWLFVDRTTPPLVAAWLRHVPVAVLAAMLLPSLLIRGDQFSLGTDNLYLWAALPTLWIAWRTRSFFAAVISGIAAVAVVRWVLVL